ncbi:MAG: hypothetical protein GKS00_01960 [Alphaproteobacteria bacterium]|nr:hypothetical protein [Alphaproteobacteria bacterium]
MSIKHRVTDLDGVERTGTLAPGDKVGFAAGERESLLSVGGVLGHELRNDAAVLLYDNGEIVLSGLSRSAVKAFASDLPPASGSRGSGTGLEGSVITAPAVAQSAAPDGGGPAPVAAASAAPSSSAAVPAGAVVNDHAPNDHAPEIISNPAVEVAEGTTGVIRVRATDADAGTTLVYSIVGGADGSRFTIDEDTGVLDFIEAPDFEMPGSSDGDNVYDVQVQVSDGAHTVPQTITVTVTDVNDNRPVINSADAVSVGEESATFVMEVTATDADAGTTLTYSIEGGADRLRFTIDENTGALAFIETPDFENPRDTDGDNVYSVMVQVSDGLRHDRQTITVTVTDRGAGFIIRGAAADGRAGWSVSSAGDVNGDGFDDLIVGVPRDDDSGEDAGAAYVVFGTAGGFGRAVDGRQVLGLSDLSAEEGFVIRGDVAYDLAGWSVSSAGDVNGDGFDDLMVGAPRSNDGGSDGGEAYVVFGKASGFGTIDLTTLSAEGGFVIRGGGSGDRAGLSVSSAGDVNGDGFDDLIVGAPDAGDGGAAYVVFGTAGGFGRAVDGRQVFDLDDLSVARGFVIRGEALDDHAGWSVSSAGDVNGDGYDDLMVASHHEGGRAYAYVVFGGASGFGSAEDPGDPAGRRVVDLSRRFDGFAIRDDPEADRVGLSVSSAGDVNGDGFDDLIVGAARDDGGEAYVVFGKASGIGVSVAGRRIVDLTKLSADEGFVIQGAAAGDQTGWSVSSAGDVNGDGFDDLIVGAPRGSGTGMAYVVFGGASGFGIAEDPGNPGGRRVFDLSVLSPDEGFVIRGAAAGDRAGFSVSSAGDVNGDGFDDLMVGAPYGGGTAGGGHVVFGGAFGAGTAPVTTAGTENDEILRGGAGDDRLAGGGGRDVIRAGAGDDVLGVSDAGFARIDGGAGRDTLRLDGSGMVLDFTSIPPSIVESIERIDLTGSGDNTLRLTLLDLLDLSDDTAGGVTTLTVLGDSGDIVRMTEDGWAVNGTTEIDGESFTRYENGNARLLVASDITAYVNNEHAPEFTAPVWHSVPEGVSLASPSVRLTAADADGDTPLTYSIVGGSDQGAFFEMSPRFSGLLVFRSPPDFESPGDNNEDNVYEVEVAVSDGNHTTTQTFMVRVTNVDEAGDPARAIDLTHLSPREGFVVRGDAAGDYAGWSVSSAGDVNGDGFEDMIVGAPRGNDAGTDAGEAYVIFGRGGAFGTTWSDGRQVFNLEHMSPREGFVIRGDDASDFLGWSVSSAGDVNGDGVDDLIVGAPFDNDGGTDAGEAYVIFGGTRAFGTLHEGRMMFNLRHMSPAEGFRILGHNSDDDAGAWDHAGWSVSSAGDVNGDGFDDLIVGAPYAPDGDDGIVWDDAAAGDEAYVIFGRGGAFGTLDTNTGRQLFNLRHMSPAEGFVVRGDGTWPAGVYLRRAT